MDFETNEPCDRCRDAEPFDLYLGEWVCRECKREMRRHEFNFA